MTIKSTKLTEDLVVIKPQQASLENKLDFSLFYKNYKSVYPNKPLPPENFLTWLIGFAEGDGCFRITTKKEPQLIITQSLYDLEVLLLIQKTLGFGRIDNASRTNKTARFAVIDLVNTSLIIHIFNGNMVLPTRFDRFMAYVAAFNTKVSNPKSRINLSIITPKQQTQLPSLKNAWLTGLTDAEGTFTMSFTKTGSFRILYQLAQKGLENKSILESFCTLFGKGAVTNHSKTGDIWHYRIGGLLNCTVICPYFEAFPLQSLKRKSYVKWLFLQDALAKGLHLKGPEEKAKLILLSKDINPKIDRSLLKPIPLKDY
jgi:LAGLIDADG endonuclease